MTTLQIDLLQEALLLTLKSHYAMPSNLKDFKEKYTLICDTWDKLELLRPQSAPVLEMVEE